MDNKKIIYCPKCGRKAGVYDGKSALNVRVKCRKCNKLVVYNVETQEVSQEKMPLRTTGSGLRFY